MPESAAKPTAPLSVELFQPDALLKTVLEVSLTGIIVLRPIYGPDGTEIIDFANEYLNPAGQRMLNQPERFDMTIGTQFPNAYTNGVFNFYRF
jgi:two-component system, sensor histidine kinase